MKNIFQDLAENPNLTTLNLEETADFLLSTPVESPPVVREDLNAFKICLREVNEDVRRAIENAELINMDGMSMVFAYEILYGKKFPRVTGCDLFIFLLSKLERNNKTAYFLGATQETLDALVKVVSLRYNKTIIAGARNGYFKRSDWEDIIDSVNRSGADFLFVGTPSPQKEEFLNFAKSKLMNGMVLMGVGGSFDVVAGKVQRAPVWMQRWSLEWLYRILQEPRRMWKRYLVTNTRFLLFLLVAKYLLLCRRRKAPRA